MDTCIKHETHTYTFSLCHKHTNKDLFLFLFLFSHTHVPPLKLICCWGRRRGGGQLSSAQASEACLGCWLNITARNSTGVGGARAGNHSTCLSLSGVEPGRQWQFPAPASRSTRPGGANQTLGTISIHVNRGDSQSASFCAPQLKFSSHWEITASVQCFNTLNFDLRRLVHWRQKHKWLQSYFQVCIVCCGN